MKKPIRFTAALVIGIVLVILIAYTAIGQDGEAMTLEEFVELTAETLMELQKTVERIADTAADKTEVRALETRVAALETAMPWPTATPTPTPFPDEARNFARQLAIDDHVGAFSDFFDFSEAEQDIRLGIYLDYFLKTVEVCKLDPDETFALLQKYAEPIHWYSPPALVAKLRNMGMGGAGWRIDFIARIATNFFVQSVIRDHGGCDSYLDWYTSG